MVGAFTVILQVILLPSEVAVMVVSPGLMPVTLPFWSIVAIIFLLLFQVILEALEVVAERFRVPPRSMEALTVLIDIFVLLTVTLQEASAFFSLAVIVTVPDPFAVTFPQVFTEAILELLLFQDASFPVEVNAIMWNSLPISTVALYLESITNAIELDALADVVGTGKEKMINIKHNKIDNKVFFIRDIKILHS